MKVPEAVLREFHAEVDLSTHTSYAELDRALEKALVKLWVYELAGPRALRVAGEAVRDDPREDPEETAAVVLCAAAEEVLDI